MVIFSADRTASKFDISSQYQRRKIYLFDNKHQIGVQIESSDYRCKKVGDFELKCRYNSLKYFSIK